MAISDYEPTFTMVRRYAPQWVSARFNEEIEQTQQLGIGEVPEELAVTWITNETDGDALDAELEALAVANSTFTFTPPNYSTQLVWRCAEWGKRFISCRVTEVTATFVNEATFT